MSEIDNQSNAANFHVLPKESGSFTLVVPTKTPECGWSGNPRISTSALIFYECLQGRGLELLSATHKDGQIRLHLQWLPDMGSQDIEWVAKYVLEVVNLVYQQDGAARTIKINQDRDVSLPDVNWEDVVSGVVAEAQHEGTGAIQVDYLYVRAQRGEFQVELKFKGCWDWHQVDSAVAAIRDKLSQLAASVAQRLLESSKRRQAKSIQNAKGAYMRVFISHSSADSGVASALIDLLRAALNLSASDIRCTSVDGYRLQGGISTDEQLRREVHDAVVFIGLVSQYSMTSPYVFFELGARWGAGKRLIPLLTPDTTANILGGPLQGINALSCNHPGQLHQLVSEIGEALETQPDVVAAYQDKIERVINCTNRAG